MPGDVGRGDDRPAERRARAPAAPDDTSPAARRQSARLPGGSALPSLPSARPADVNAHPPRPSAPTVLVVASGKGGVGVSLVSALLGLGVAGEGWRVLLVDGAESYGGLHLVFGARPRPPLAALPGGSTDGEALLTPAAETLALFLGGGAGAPDALPRPAAERQLVFRRIADIHDQFDLVVIDAGSRLESVLAACEAGVTHLLTVVTEDRIALAASDALLAAIEVRLPGLPVGVLVNRATERRARRVHAGFAEATAHLAGGSPRLVGAIPDDPCLRGGLGAGMILPDAASGSPAAAAARLAGVALMTDEREPARPVRALALTT